MHCVFFCYSSGWKLAIESSVQPRRFISKGAKVAIGDLNEEKMDKLAHELGRDNLIWSKCDVTDHNQVKSAIHSTVKTFGGLHVALPCAGIV